MALLGFNAIGRYALGQIGQPQDANPRLVGAAGGGVAAGAIPTTSTFLSGVSGQGSAGSFSEKSASRIAGVAGVGSVGAITPQVTVPTVGVPGAGAAGSTVQVIVPTLNGAEGIGNAGTIMTSSTAPQLVGVAGGGLAGSFLPKIAKPLLGVAGIGVAGRILPAMSGGGSSERIHRSRQRTGFDTIKKRYEPVIAKPEVRQDIVPPPSMVRRSQPLLDPIYDPLPLPDGVMPDIPTLLESIRQAEVASAMLKVVEENHARRQRQDEEDIAELLAFLDAQDQA